MTAKKEPQTLADLLRTMETGADLRGLARECGLSVRELRRRLAVWRRELVGAEGTTAAAGEGGEAAASRREVGGWPELPDASTLTASPLPAEGSRILEIHTDGASKGNPGPAAIAAVFAQKDGPLLCAMADVIGEATNNVAEYRAVVAAMELCERWQVSRVHLNVDSELIARQLQGRYRVKSPDLRPLYQRVIFLTRDLRTFTVRHVPREKNAHADHLANLALRPRRRR